MTEYWVSKQSYFCKYCEIYIKDDKPSRAQHENGLRHKNNLEKFIRDIYKKSDLKKKSKLEEAREIEKINEAARLSFEKNNDSINFGHNDQSLNKNLNSIGSSSKRKLEDDPDDRDDEGIQEKKLDNDELEAKKDWKGVENIQNYSDARSLGLIDQKAVDEELLIQSENQLRSNEGTIGTWQAVAPTKTHNPSLGTIASNNSKPLEKLALKLNNNSDKDHLEGLHSNSKRKKLFTERSLEDEDQIAALDDLEIKVKVNRSSNLNIKDEDQRPSVHGSLGPIRLDGVKYEDDEEDSKPFRSSSVKNNSENYCNNNGETTKNESVQIKKEDEGEEDVKPKVEELQEKEKGSSNVVFKKKRKTVNAQPRQRT